MFVDWLLASFHHLAVFSLAAILSAEIFLTRVRPRGRRGLSRPPSPAVRRHRLLRPGRPVRRRRQVVNHGPARFNRGGTVRARGCRGTLKAAAARGFRPRRGAPRGEGVKPRIPHSFSPHPTADGYVDDPGYERSFVPRLTQPRAIRGVRDGQGEVRSRVAERMGRRSNKAGTTSISGRASRDPPTRRLSPRLFSTSTTRSSSGRKESGRGSSSITTTMAFGILLLGRSASAGRSTTRGRFTSSVMCSITKFL